MTDDLNYYITHNRFINIGTYTLAVRENSKVFTNNMEIPKYKVQAIYTHLKRIVENAKVDYSDTRTINAIRLARQDLRQLKKYLDNGK